MSDEFKKHAHIGPGGMKCTCCAPPAGKNRDKLRRAARARLKMADKKHSDDKE